jgi:hypothetical protein
LDALNPLGFSYTHDGSETTTDSFTFNISDAALSSSATVSVTVSPVNDQPITNNDVYYIGGASYTITKPGVGLLGNDVDPENNDFIAMVVTQPLAGTLVVNEDGTFTYTPNTNSVFNTDSFTYSAIDPFSNSDPNAATVTFNSATLIPVPDSYTLNEGENLVIEEASGLTVNDVDSNDFSIDSLWVVTQPKYGTITLASDFKGGFSYQHDGSENFQDLFEYKIKNSNGDLSEKTFVNLFADNVNDAPTSTGTVVSLNEGAENIFNLSYTDTDSPLTLIDFQTTSEPTNGNIINNGLGNIRYIHNGGETTSDSFTYTVGDGEFTSSQATVSITVLPVNDLPSALAFDITVAEGGTVNPLNFAGTDIETEDSALTFKLVTPPTNGIVTVDNYGVWIYTHNGTETSSDSFTYSANDGTDNGAVSTVNVSVTAVNSSPVTTAGSFTLAEAGNIDYDLKNNASDSDSSAEDKIIIIVSVPSNGSLTDPDNSGAAVTAGTTLAGGVVTYTHGGGENLTDSFTFKANDTNSDSNISKISVTVTALNDLPTIASVNQIALVDNASTVNVDEKDKVDITIQASDVDSTTLTYSIVSAASSGTLTGSDGTVLVNGNTFSGGVLTYTSTASISSDATDSFQV